jgi:hypothetical protein
LQLEPVVEMLNLGEKRQRRGKTGGRKPGQPNPITRDLKELILRRGKPLEHLCDVARGLKIRVGPQAGPGAPEFIYPSMADRLSAARTLLGKVVPDMKAVDLGGAPDGVPIQVDDTNEVARRRAEALPRLGEALREAG